MKIVRLLEDMRVELQNGLEDDKAVHESLDCWCNTGKAEKTKAIALAETRISELEATIGEAAAEVRRLTEKRKATQDEQYANQKSLDTAEQMRMEENKKFHAEEADLIEAVDATGNAIIALSSHHPEFTQIRNVASSLRTAGVIDLMLKSNPESRYRMTALKDFLVEAEKSPDTAFLAIPGYQSYAPQSGQIFGILKRMKKDFEDDLKQVRDTEAKSVANFQMLRSAKLSEIALAKKTIVQIDVDIGNLKSKHAQAFKQKENTEAQLALDREFLKNLKVKCSESDAEFDKRTKDRLAEIAAVDETIQILNSDESFANFDTTVNSALFQVKQSSAREASLRKRAVDALRHVAKPSPKLSFVLLSTQLDTFEKVKAEIDKLVSELGKQQEDEVAHRDWCIENQDTNVRDTAAAADKKSNLEARIVALKRSIADFKKDLKNAATEISDAQDQMKRRSENREAENADFQQTVLDQRVTQTILTKALARMRQVYALLQRQPGAPHIETSGTHTDPGNGPARFTKYQANVGGRRVLDMLSKVLQDSKTMENDAIESEEDSQAEYESFMMGSNEAIARLLQSISDMKEGKAQNTLDLNAANADLKATITELEGLGAESADLHGSCDFIINNFDLRQEARTAEINALREAKAILSGMK